MKDTRGRLLSQAGIVGLLAAYACFAWPGLYHLAAHVLDVREHLTVFGWQVQRAWLYPAAVDGGIFVAGCILLTQKSLKKRDARELWWGMWTVAALSGLGLVVDTLAKSVGWQTPLILAPVVIATWFLHMVVRVQAEAAGDADAVPSHREEVTDAGGSGDSVPVRNPDPSAPDGTSDGTSDSIGDLMSTVAGSNGNGHGKTKVAKAVATVAAYRQSNGGRLPSRPELALLAGVSESTARDALALTRKD